MIDDLGELWGWLVSSQAVLMGSVISGITWVLAVLTSWRGRGNQPRHILIWRTTTGLTMVFIDLILVIAFTLQPGGGFFKLAIAAVVGFQIVSGMAAILAFNHDQK